jgi:regulator of protease activity HflC (stomatin/prohibitin superfamily)
MFERLFDFLTTSWNVLRPVVVVTDYEGGVILRLGRFERVIKPGLHWKIPLAENAIITSTVITTMALRPQTLTTKDDLTIVLSAIVKYHISDVRSYLLDIWDSADVINDLTLGTIRKIVASVDYKDLRGDLIEREVHENIRDEACRYGVDIHKVTFSDLGKVRSLRLITNELIDNINQQQKI